VTGDGTTTISTPSDVHCNHCDHVNHNVDIFDDLRTGDWAYLFECVSCERINDEHGSNLERGAITPLAQLALFGAAVVGILLWIFHPVIFWTLIGVLAWAAFVLLIIAVFIGAKQGENHHE